MSFTICAPSKKTLFALVDGNNFFVSCERIFNPHLNHKPVVVLSSNDGCAIARSNEAKAFGIKMGAPLHTFHHLVKAHDVTLLSCNFELYGDISSRMMHVLKTFAPDVDIYSIDEAFIDLSKVIDQNLSTFAKRIFDTILKWIGIPITIGIAPTKTLAKMANRIAKKRCDPHLVLQSEAEIENALSCIDVSEVWGIGRAMTPKLKKQGIYTALDLARLDPRTARQKYTISGERLVRELQGFSCAQTNEHETHKQSIQVTRSFGMKLREFNDIAEAISMHATTLGEKLRADRLNTSFISVFCRTSLYGNSDQFMGTANIGFEYPINDTQTLINAALEALRQCYEEGYNYQSAGIRAFYLEPEDQVKQMLLNRSIKHEGFNLSKIGALQRKNMSTAIDALNHKFGKNTLFWASSGIKPKHEARKNRRTNRYTTKWEELLVVH